MTSTLQHFTAPCGTELRTVVKDGQIFFVGKDVAQALGYVNTKSALARHCRGVRATYPIIDSLGRTQEVRIIGEPDFFRLVCGSEIPSAQAFESWVFEEVLPAIHRSGGYMVSVKDETPEQLMARALKVAEETLARAQARNKELENTIEEAKPKVLFADAVADSDSTCLIGELAKIIRQNGYPIGQNRLFKWLRENRYLTRQNQPTQHAMERELFRVIERAVLQPNGTTMTVRTTKVTGKGQQYFINIFLNQSA